jgi:hypothetical protein
VGDCGDRIPIDPVTQRENQVPETLYRKSCPIADRIYAIVATAKDKVNDDLLAFIKEDPKVERVEVASPPAHRF